MSANIVIVFEYLNRRALSTTINNLKSAGFTVYEQVSDGWQTGPGDDNKEKAKHIANSYKDKNIDFGIIATHNGNPSMKIFQQIVNPKYGYYDIEHDIFSSIVELSPLNRLGTFSFTKLQTKILKRKNARVIEAEWYKFDNCESYRVADDKNLNNAVLIDTAFAKNTPFPYHYLFDNIYLKSLSKSIQYIKCKSDLITNAAAWSDTQAVVDMRDLGYFWFSVVSSAVVEALMMNRMPILWCCSGRFKLEEPVDDVVSRVFFDDLKHDPFHRFNEDFLVVTDKNMDHKIKILRDDYVRRQGVLNTLKSQWVFDSPRNKVYEELIKDISRVLAERSVK